MGCGASSDRENTATKRNESFTNFRLDVLCKKRNFKKQMKETPQRDSDGPEDKDVGSPAPLQPIDSDQLLSAEQSAAFDRALSNLSSTDEISWKPDISDYQDSHVGSLLQQQPKISSNPSKQNDDSFSSALGTSSEGVDDSRKPSGTSWKFTSPQIVEMLDAFSSASGSRRRTKSTESIPPL